MKAWWYAFILLERLVFSELAKAIRSRIPKVALKTQAGKDLAHLVRLGTPGDLL